MPEPHAPPATHPPSITHRISLRFLPAPSTERTTTLVLNAGRRSNLYTDFRPLIADPSACEWAFAGAKEYLADGRCRWTHPVDSRRTGGAEEDREPDIGRSQVLPNGNELETGEMRNSETGRVEPYEEVWREEEVKPGSRIIALQLRDADQHVRGVFVRVSTWAQGVVALTEGDGVCARRWKFDGMGDSRWVLVAAYGDSTPMMPEPRGDSLDDNLLTVPEKETESSIVWETVEDYTWDGKK